MPGIKVGEGYVEVRIKSDLDDDVKAAETKASPQAEKSGDSLGKTMAKGIGGAFAGLKLGEMITGAVDQSAVTANLQAKLSGTSKVVAAQAGKAAGKVFADGYGENLEEVNDSINSINDNLGGLAKYSQSQTQSMSKDALTIANVYGQDVNDVIRTAGGLMKNGLAKNADDAFDIISKGFQSGLNNSDELLDSLNEYAEPLHALGLDGPKALSAFKASMDAGNFSIDKAGDSLNEFATRATDGSKSTAEGFEAIGLNGDKMGAKIAAGGKSARDGLSETIGALANMKDPLAQNQAGAALFGSMWEDAGKDTILALDPAKASIDKVKGSTDKMADANQSAANKVETMKRGIDQWKNSLIKTNGPVGDVTTILGTMGPEGIAAGAGVITASKGLGEMAAGAGKGAKALGGWVAGLFASKAPMVATSAITTEAAGAQWAFNSAILANPITWIVVGIVALIAAIILLIANWDTVVKFITDTWSGFMSWIKPALDTVGAWWSGLWSSISGFVRVVWAAITTWVVSTFQSFVAGIKVIGSAISSWWSGLWGGIKNAAVSIWNTIKSSATNAFNGVVSTIQSVVGGVKTWWNDLVGWVGGIPGRIGSAVSGMWDGIKSGFRGVINGVIKMWNDLSFTVPGLEVFGHKIGGFTLSTPNLPYFEKGTNYFGGGPAIVGENGPEMVNLPRGASVTNAGGTERALAGGGGDTYVTNSITINEAEDPLGSGGRVDAILRKWSKK